MRHRQRFPSTILAAAVTLACHPSPSVAGHCDPGSGALVCQPAAITQTCFWGQPAGRQDGGNALAPDTNVTYYYSYSRFQLPAGAQVQLRGTFPHARFLSFTTYYTVGTMRGVANTSLTDTDLAPDPGSQNPFRPGTRRTVRRRRFTVDGGREGGGDPIRGRLGPLGAPYAGRDSETRRRKWIRLERTTAAAEVEIGVAGTGVLASSGRRSR